jgi:hypothetical protein
MVTATDLDPRDFGPQGPSGYLTKPFFAEDLLTAVRSNLRAHRAAS